MCVLDLAAGLRRPFEFLPALGEEHVRSFPMVSNEEATMADMPRRRVTTFMERLVSSNEHKPRNVLKVRYYVAHVLNLRAEFCRGTRSWSLSHQRRADRVYSTQ